MISSSTPATYQRVFFPDSFFQYESSWAEKTRVIEEGGHYWKARISDNNCFSDGGLVLLRTSLVFFKIPTCLYNSTMHSARFLFLYYNSPINLCMILLAILHQLGIYKVITPTYVNVCPSIISVEKRKIQQKKYWCKKSPFHLPAT